MSSFTALLVGWALWQAQLRGELEDVGPLTYPATISDTFRQGWPQFCLLRHRYGEMFVPSSMRTEYRVLSYGNLALNFLVWAAIVIATGHVTRQMLSSRGQWPLRALFAATAATALLLGWWRIEYNACVFPNHPGMTELLLAMPQTPMLRLLQFPAHVYVPVLFGEACVILAAVTVVCRVWHHRNRRTRKMPGMPGPD